MATLLESAPSCELCQALHVGRIDKASCILTAVSSYVDYDETAILLLVKFYSGFLKYHSQCKGVSHVDIWQMKDIPIGNIRIKVFQLLKLMFAKGLSVNNGPCAEMPLLCAINTHDKDLVRILLEHGADANVFMPKLEMNSTALAIILNDVKILKLLLSFGANVNEPCCQQITPLQLSVNKSVSVSQLLLQNGADMEQVFHMRGSHDVFLSKPPLIHAVEMNNLYLASILLDHLEDVNQTYGECANTAVHFAVLAGSSDMLKLLLQYGANLNIRNGRGHTPLGLALSQLEGNITVVETLLRCGCSWSECSVINVFQRDFPPLHIAAFYGTEFHFEVLKLLIEMALNEDIDSCFSDISRSSEVQQINSCEHMSKHCLNDYERTIDLIEKKQQAFINSKAKDNSSALYMSVLGGNLEIAKYLYENGADPYLMCCHGNLMHAAVMASKSGLEMLKFSLQFDFDIDMFNEDGNTCLILAARNSNPDLCRLLVEHGASLNVQDGRYGETALSISVYFGFEDNAKTLICYGADPNVPDSRNTTALYWAIFNCRERTLELLLEAGAKLTQSDLAVYPKSIRVMQNPRLRKLLKDYVSSPHSLQQYCRNSIRKQLMEVQAGESIMLCVMSLPLPTKLKKYIALMTDY